jgi:hypothetical protein
MFTKLFWRDAAERSISTAAQSALLALGQDVAGFDVFAADWRNVVGFAAGGAVLAMLKALAAVRVSGAVSPASFASEV